MTRRLKPTHIWECGQRSKVVFIDLLQCTVIDEVGARVLIVRVVVVILGEGPSRLSVQALL